MKFRAVVELNGKTATGIEVPAKVLDGLGAGKRPPVRVTINGHTFRTTLGSMDGRVMLPISADIRAGAGIAAGQKVDVEITHDSSPREAAVPADLKAALAKDSAARKCFEALTESKRRYYVGWIESAKKDETRQKRVADAVAELHAGRPRF